MKPKVYAWATGVGPEEASDLCAALGIGAVLTPQNYHARVEHAIGYVPSLRHVRKAVLARGWDAFLIGDEPNHPDPDKYRSPRDYAETLDVIASELQMQYSYTDTPRTFSAGLAFGFGPAEARENYALRGLQWLEAWRRQLLRAERHPDWYASRLDTTNRAMNVGAGQLHEVRRVLEKYQDSTFLVNVIPGRRPIDAALRKVLGPTLAAWLAFQHPNLFGLAFWRLRAYGPDDRFGLFDHQGNLTHVGQQIARAVKE